MYIRITQKLFGKRKLKLCPLAYFTRLFFDNHFVQFVLLGGKCSNQIKQQQKKVIVNEHCSLFQQERK